MILIRSFLIKLGMLVVVAGVLLWIGRPLVDREAGPPLVAPSAEPEIAPHTTSRAGPPPTIAVPARPPVRTTGLSRTASPGAKLDLNRASMAELQTLPGIGAVLAQRIVERRTAQPFHAIDELTDVKGIGEKRFARVRPLVTVGPGSGPVSAASPRVKGKL